MSTTAIRIVLADDHETIRQGLRALLASVEGLDVVDEVGDGESAVASVRAFAPDVLILDLGMPGIGGLATIRRLADEGSNAAVVVLTRYGESSFVRQALAAGASAYVLKQSPFAEVHLAVAHAARGERYLDPRLVLVPDRTPIPDPSKPVTNRERDVLRRAALGHSNKEIAVALGIAVKTVEVHKTQAMRKLRLQDRSAMVRFAVLHGWLHEP